MVADMAATTHFKRQIAVGEMGDRLWFLENAWPETGQLELPSSSTLPRVGFSRPAFSAGLAATDWTWAIQLADYDNDGRLDVFTTNGTSRMFTDADHPITLAMMIGKGRRGPLEGGTLFQGAQSCIQKSGRHAV